MADARQELAAGRGELPFHALRMIDVVLHEGIQCADFLENRDCLAGSVQIEAWNVEGVHRLDQKPQPGLAECGGRMAKIFHEGVPQPRPAHPGRRYAGKAVELRHAEHPGVFDRQGDAVPEFGDPLRMARDAALPAIPIAGGQVVQYRREARGIEARTDVGGRVGIGKLEFDRGEAIACSQGEALEKWHFGVEHAQIGGKAWHGIDSRTPVICRSDADFNIFVGGLRELAGEITFKPQRRRLA